MLFQARLNPHFLYNILDSISSSAKLKDEYDISDWICLLSDMLRESIGQRLIPLMKKYPMSENIRLCIK